MKSFLLLLWLLMVPAVVRAQFTFTTNNDAITITGYDTAAGNVAVIPGMTNGYDVTGIASNAFSGSSLAGITIPGSVATIGDWAFFSCQNLTNVTMSNGVSSIGNYAFMECTALAGITFPDSVTNLGLESFASCENLNSVDFGNGVSIIGDSAFRDCFSLTNVSIPDSVTSIGGGAFSVCKSLANVIIGSGVTNIEGGPFLVCTNLMAITVDGNNPAYSSLNGVLFNKNHSYIEQYPIGRTGSYQIPKGVTLIAGDSFAGCLGLTGIAIPDGVTNIIGTAFVGCLGLTNVTLPASVSFIGGGAFGNCTNLVCVFFKGNAPATMGPMPVFSGLAINAIGFYLPNKTGWSSLYSGLPTVLWNPQAQTGDGRFGVMANQFGFNITGATNDSLVVEACTNPAGGDWVPLQTVTLASNSCYFCDPQWTNYPARFYRIRSP